MLRYSAQQQKTHSTRYYIQTTLQSMNILEEGKNKATCINTKQKITWKRETVHTHTHTHTHTHARARARACTHTRTHALTHTRTHAHTNTQRDPHLKTPIHWKSIFAPSLPKCRRKYKSLKKPRVQDFVLRKSRRQKRTLTSTTRTNQRDTGS